MHHVKDYFIHHTSYIAPLPRHTAHYVSRYAPRQRLLHTSYFIHRPSTAPHSTLRITSYTHIIHHVAINFSMYEFHAFLFPHCVLEQLHHRTSCCSSLLDWAANKSRWQVTDTVLLQHSCTAINLISSPSRSFHFTRLSLSECLNP